MEVIYNSVVSLEGTFVQSTMEVMNDSVVYLEGTFVQSRVVVNYAKVYLAGINIFSNNFISNDG